MNNLNRRSFLRQTAAAGTLIATAPFNIASIYSDEVTQAIRTLMDDLPRGHCGHYMFIANCLGPWVQSSIKGLKLFSQLGEIDCHCKEDILLTATCKINGRDYYEDNEVFLDSRSAPFEYHSDEPKSFRDQLKNILMGIHYQKKLSQREKNAPLSLDSIYMDFDEGPLEYPMKTAFDLLWNAPNDRVGRDVLLLLVLPLGLELDISLWPEYSLWPFKKSECVGNEEPLSTNVKNEIVRVAAHHPSGHLRILARQAIGEFQLDDVISMCTFMAATEVEMLDSLPQRRPVSRSLAHQILRKSLDTASDPTIASIGLGLMRDKDSYDLMANRIATVPKKDIKYAMFSQRCSLTLADYERGLPGLHQGMAPRVEKKLFDVHWSDVGSVGSTPEDTGTLFPYEESIMHEVLRFISHRELANASARGSSYASRTEAAIELAHRWKPDGPRWPYDILLTAIDKACPCDAIRILHATMLASPRNGRALGQAMLGHSDWEVRITAAGAVLHGN